MDAECSCRRTCITAISSNISNERFRTTRKVARPIFSPLSIRVIDNEYNFRARPTIEESLREERGDGKNNDLTQSPKVFSLLLVFFFFRIIHRDRLQVDKVANYSIFFSRVERSRNNGLVYFEMPTAYHESREKARASPRASFCRKRFILWKRGSLRAGKV